jgi:integrase
MAFTVKGVARLSAPGRYRDAPDHPGLHLQITPPGVKSWILRYQRNGRERWHGLGPFHTVGLAQARERARAARLLLLDGIDPIDHRRQTHEASALEAAKHKTFGEVAQAYLAAHDKDWKNPKHVKQWQASFTQHCKPIAHLPIAAIDTAHILEVLAPIWHRTPETASRIRARIERVIAYAIAAKYRERADGNPAQWDGHLKELLGSKSGAQRAKRERSGTDGHHSALPYAELPDFMRELRDRSSIAARALEFAILSAARTAEITGAQWTEIDLDARTWTVPAERMKAGKRHVVPLSERALTILQTLPREHGNTHVFIGGRARAPLSNKMMLELLKGLRPATTVHGCRSSFKDWCSERTNFPREVSEMALAHAVGDKVEAAYRRGDLFEKRRQLMAAWARYCEQPPSSQATGDVVTLRGAR